MSIIQFDKNDFDRSYLGYFLIEQADADEADNADNTERVQEKSKSADIEINNSEEEKGDVKDQGKVN
jgi:hypothetical protein